MEYTKLGRTGLEVSRLCMGTLNLGQYLNTSDSIELLEGAFNKGINFFDTANVYNNGLSEQIIGEWFVNNPGRREKIVLATKVYNKTSDVPNHGGLSAYHIRQACEDSLRRLQTDHIDLYQMHHVDRATPWEEIWQAMELLVKQGKVIYIGSSNFAAWQIVQAQNEAEKRHFFGLVSEQSKYSLKDRTVELEVIPACRALGMGFLPWSPLGGGKLAGNVVGALTGRRSSEWVKSSIHKIQSNLDSFESLCHELGETPADVALAWVLHNPDVASPVIGPRTIDQLIGNIHSLEINLTKEILLRLDAIFPGPGGEAPEAYAW
jgi:aryl-alcohol dehydrogenase-like predicted oxidoreductase